MTFTLFYEDLFVSDYYNSNLKLDSDLDSDSIWLNLKLFEELASLNKICYKIKRIKEKTCFKFACFKDFQIS